MRMVRISTRPIVMAAIMSHLYAMGMATVVAPIETPFVESAEPTSKRALVKETPMVVKSIAKTISTTMNSSMEIIAGKNS